VDGDPAELPDTVQRVIGFRAYRIRRPQDVAQYVGPTCIARGLDYGEDGWFETSAPWSNSLGCG
jgi:hypothetical protein